MGPRRILTAREQVAMMAPWRKTATPGASWPDDLAHHLDEPTGYSAGYAAYHHPAFAGDWNKAEEAYYVNAGGAGSKFEDGFEDAGEGAPHRIDQVSKKYKPLRDIASELRQRRHNEFSGMGDLTVNEHGMPARSEGLSTSHPKGSWEGCPTCNPRQGMDGGEYQDPDDNTDPFDPRMLGASRRTAAEIENFGNNVPDPESAAGLNHPAYAEQPASSGVTRIPPDAPHDDWRPMHGDPNHLQWHPAYGESHMKYHIYPIRAGGAGNTTQKIKFWRANSHGLYEGMQTIPDPGGRHPNLEMPKYSNEDDPERVMNWSRAGNSHPLNFRSLDDAKAAVEEYHHENYGTPPSHDYDIDSIMDEHGAPPAAGNRGLGDDEDYSRIFDAAMRRYAGDRADLEWQRDGSGDWVLIGRNPDGNPVALMTKPAPNVRTSSRYYYTDAEAYGHDDDDDDDDDAWVEGERAPAEAEYPDGYCDWCDGKLSDPTAQPKWDGASYRWLCDTCHDAISGPAHRHLSDEMRMYRGWDPDGEDFDAGDPRIKGARRTAANGGDYDNWEEYDKPEDWVEDDPLEDETEEKYLRRVYDPYPTDSSTLPDNLKPHVHLPIDVVHHYREFDRPYDKNTQMIERVIGDQGIRQPLKISTDGTHAMLIEGNHRLHAARRLGMTHLPVQVFLEKPGQVMGNKSADMLAAHPDYHSPAPLEPVLGDWLKRNGHTLRSFWD